MKHILIFFALLFSYAVHAQNAPLDREIEKQLKQLDSIVEKKATYHAGRNEQIERLKQQSQQADGHNRIALYKEIFYLYSHYQTDSAQIYLDLIAATPEAAESPVLQAFIHIGQAEIYSISALYGEAVNELQKVDTELISAQNPALRLYYYRTWRTLCGWITSYVKLSQPRRLWGERMVLYRDSLILIDEPGESRSIVEADKAIANGQPQQAVELLLPYARKMSEDMPDPYICFTLYMAYNAMDKQREAIHFLIMAAKADIKRGTTEYQALPLLALKVYEQGEVERAYNYLICSMEDANFCQAGLRAVEVSNVFPIIDKQYKTHEREQHRKERIFTYILVGLLLALSIGILYLRKQMKKLSMLRQQQTVTNNELAQTNEKMQHTMQQLQKTNEELQQTYAELQLTDKVKEEYIARYLNRCRNYLETLIGYRRNTLRLLKERRTDELMKSLKSEAVIKEEQDKFYDDFDQAFLTLFPDFIQKFNNLLQPEFRIQPRHDKRLTTELRIFALIRLGVTDTTQIAHFLNFSLATVYNYRSKMRNKSLNDPTDFERAVSEL